MSAESPAELVLAPGELMDPVLARVVGTLGARARLEMDRLVDALVAARLIVLHLRDPALGVSDPARLRVGPSDEGLVIAVGPLPPGRAARIRAREASPGLGVTIDRLADRVSVERLPEGERLVVVVGRAGPNIRFGAGPAG